LKSCPTEATADCKLLQLSLTGRLQQADVF